MAVRYDNKDNPDHLVKLHATTSILRPLQPSPNGGRIIEVRIYRHVFHCFYCLILLIFTYFVNMTDFQTDHHAFVNLREQILFQIYTHSCN